ncbi:SNF5/SMARCB1/INI1 [Carpediemonas membranifera]|uniref:SNF5/SMARCB1/INI1 n=1 Tax=Carpediemonas membranifera TaxID=201153 RepID=A0A8J6ATC0_9EUKA|nr:SNF5/SMARCB1/INI1 [Carpediemonas membranifera]|eukprot:KAG9391880.1 SNF5/SMARCB1/INI1 [Carpediemonas membranifera]
MLSVEAPPIPVAPIIEAEVQPQIPISTEKAPPPKGPRLELDNDLIPVHLNVELGDTQFKDFFFWKASESNLTPQEFITRLCDDHDLPSSFDSALLEQLNAQIEAFIPYRFDSAAGERYHALGLDIWMDGFHLTDKVLWDTNDPNNHPVPFATTLASDLGLDSRFAVAIAHQLYTQLVTIDRLRNTHTDLELPTAAAIPSAPFRGIDSAEWAPSIQLAATWEPMPGSVRGDQGYHSELSD